MKMLKEIKERGLLYESHAEEIENDRIEKIHVARIEDIKPVTYIQNIPVIIAPSVLSDLGAFMACLIISPERNYTVVIDDLFKELSLNAKQYVLGHELGHYNLGHLKKFEDPNYSYIFNPDDDDAKNKIELEYQADEYAAKMFGYANVAKAIDEIIAVINKSMKKGVLSNINLTYVKHIMGKRKHHLMK